MRSSSQVVSDRSNQPEVAEAVVRCEARAGGWQVGGRLGELEGMVSEQCNMVQSRHREVVRRLEELAAWQER